MHNESKHSNYFSAFVKLKIIIGKITKNNSHTYFRTGKAKPWVTSSKATFLYTTSVASNAPPSLISSINKLTDFISFSAASSSYKIF